MITVVRPRTKAEGSLLDGIPRDERLAVALDPGNKCGYALTYVPDDWDYDLGKLSICCGQLDLTLGSYDSGPVRFCRLRNMLTALRPSIVFVEDIRFNPPHIPGLSLTAIVARVSGTTEFFGGFKATISEWCERHQVPCHYIGIKIIKMRAVGKGVAKKELIIEAARDQLGADLSPEGYETSGHDNVADALWALVCGLEEYGRGLLPPVDTGEENARG